jgi:hypothetical protein
MAKDPGLLSLHRPKNKFHPEWRAVVLRRPKRAQSAELFNQNTRKILRMSDDRPFKTWPGPVPGYPAAELHPVVDKGGDTRLLEKVDKSSRLKESSGCTRAKKSLV